MNKIILLEEKNNIMLKLENISKRYENFKVLKNVDLNFCSASFNVVVGKSGSGKTTLLNIIGGLDKSSSGNIIYNETTINNKNIDAYRNTFVSIVFQQLNLIEDFNIKQNLKLAFELAKKEITDDNIANILAKVNLPDDGDTIEELLAKKPNQLSVGQKQRLAIARALIKNPQILLLDEPTSALDDENAESIVLLLKELSKNCIVIVSTHARSIFDKVADQIIELKEKTTHIIKNDSKIEDFSNKNQKLKKGYLSFFETFRFAIRNLKYRKVRLVTSFVIALISNILFGSVYLITTCDANSVFLRTQVDNDMNIASIVKFQTYYDQNNYLQTTTGNFTSEEIEKIDEYTNGAYVSLDAMSLDFEIYNNNGSRTQLLTNYYNNLYKANINETLASNLGFAPYDGLSKEKQLECRLPQNNNEIAISRVLAQTIVDGMMAKFDYYEFSWDFYFFDSVDELMGMTINDCTIVGIYEMEDDMFDFWIQYLPMTYDDYVSKFLTSDEISYVMNMTEGFSISRCIFGYDEIESNSSMYLVKLSGNYYKDLNFLNSFSTDNNYVDIMNQYSGFTDTVNMFSNDLALTIVWSIITVFLFISILISMNMFYSNVKSMERKLGILKAMGASKEQTMFIITTQTMFITMLEYVFSLVGIVIFASVFNNNVNLSMLRLSLALAAILLVLLIGIAMLVSLPASRRALLERPIDIIEEK